MSDQDVVEIKIIAYHRCLDRVLDRARFSTCF